MKMTAVNHRMVSFVLLSVLLAACSGSKSVQLNSRTRQNSSGACSVPMTGAAILKSTFNGGTLTAGNDVVFEIQVSGGCATNYRLIKDSAVLNTFPALGTGTSVTNFVKQDGYGVGTRTEVFFVEPLKEGVPVGPALRLETPQFTVAAAAAGDPSCMVSLSPNLVQIPKTAAGGLAFAASTNVSLVAYNSAQAPLAVNILEISTTYGSVPVPAHSPASMHSLSLSTAVEGNHVIQFTVRDPVGSRNAVCSTVFSVVGVVTTAPRVDLRVSSVGGTPTDGPLSSSSSSSFELHWAVQDVGNCVLNPGAVAISTPTGMRSMSPVSSSTTYTLSCQTPAGQTISDSVEVRVVWLNLTAAYVGAPASDGPVIIPNGHGVDLFWNSSGLASCTLSPNLPNFSGMPSGGPLSSGALTARTVFTISCLPIGGGTVVTDSVEVRPYWFSVDRVDCNTFCTSRGKTVGVTPDGHSCASGEVRPASAYGKVNFKYGCWSDGSCRAAEGPAQGRSAGPYCYGSGQNRDNDPTDNTVGCFCAG